MSGSIKNDWDSYLNGGSDQFNFSYNRVIPSQPTIPSPSPTPSPSPPPSQPPNSPSPSSPQPTMPNMPAPMPGLRKNANIKLHYKIGGKRKTKRATKKRRHSRRK